MPLQHKLAPKFMQQIIQIGILQSRDQGQQRKSFRNYTNRQHYSINI